MQPHMRSKLHRKEKIRKDRRTGKVRRDQDRTRDVQGERTGHETRGQLKGTGQNMKEQDRRGQRG